MAKIGVITAPLHCNGLPRLKNKPGQNVATAAAPGATHFKISMAPGLSLQQVDLSREQTPDDAASHSKTAARAMQNCASTSSTCRRLCHFVIEGMGEGGVYASTHVIVYDMCRRPHPEDARHQICVLRRRSVMSFPAFPA